MRRAVVWIGAWGLVACAANPSPSLHAAYAQELARAVSAAQTAEIDLYRIGQVTATDHRAWQQGFLALAQTIQVYVAAIRATDPSRRAAAMRDFGVRLTDLGRTLLPRVSDGTARLALQLTLDGVRAVFDRWPTVEPSWIPPPSPSSCAWLPSWAAA